jgi:anti-sigma factor RsiW
MTHITRQIQAYLDGELAPSLEPAFLAHIEHCDACRRELAAARKLWELVDQAASPAARGTVWPHVAARLEHRRRRVAWTWPQRGLAAAALAAGVVVGLQFGDPVDLATDTGLTTVVSEDYLEDSLPTLDQVWLQLSDLDEDEES